METLGSAACTKTMMPSSWRLAFVKADKTSKHIADCLFHTRTSEEDVEILGTRRFLGTFAKSISMPI